MHAAAAAGAITVSDPLESALRMWALAHGLILLYQDGRFAISEAQFKRVFRRALWTLLAGMGGTVPS